MSEDEGIQWQEVALDDLMTRRAALIGIIEAGLPELPTKITLSKSQLMVLDDESRNEAWNFVWSLEQPVTIEGHSLETIQACALAGPSHMFRLSGDDDPTPFFESSGTASSEPNALLVKLFSFLRRNGRDCVGFGPQLSWRDGTVTPRHRLNDEGAVQAHTPPDKPEAIESLDARSVMFFKEFQPHVLDLEQVRTEAKRDYAKRESENPWRDLFRAAMTEEGRSFCRQAHQDLIGFSSPRDGEPVVIRARRLPFYKATDLIDILDKRGGYPRVARFLADFQADAAATIQYTRVQPINWNALPIHAKNRKEGLTLTRDTVRPYVDFFCQYIGAEDGYFRLVESTDVLSWIGVRQSLQKAAAKHIRPLELWTPEAVEIPDAGLQHYPRDQWFLVSSTVVYARALFRSWFAINVDGFAEMIEDDPVGDRLPIVPEAISETTHFVYVSREEMA